MGLVSTCFIICAKSHGQLTMMAALRGIPSKPSLSFLCVVRRLYLHHQNLRVRVASNVFNEHGSTQRIAQRYDG